MAPFVCDYCSLTPGVLKISSTTRNHVPRFKRWSQGGRLGLRNSSECSWSWLFFSKRLIHYVDVFILLFQVIMMKLSSFLRELHRTYDRVRGVFWKNGLLQGLLSGQYHRGRWRKVSLELQLKKLSRAK